MFIFGRHSFFVHYDAEGAAIMPESRRGNSTKHHLCLFIIKDNIMTTKFCEKRIMDKKAANINSFFANLMYNKL